MECGRAKRKQCPLMEIIVKSVILAVAMISVAGCGDGDVSSSSKYGWKRIEARHYTAMDDMPLLRRWVDIDYNGELKNEVEDKGGVEAVLSKAGGKLDEKARRCLINMVVLNDALEGMGASRVVVTSVLDKASHAHMLKWEMSADEVVALLPGVAELYGVLSGINAPPLDLAECLVKDFIDEPPEKRPNAIKEFNEKAAKYLAVRACLVDVGVPREQAEEGLAQFVFLHGSGLPKDEFWKNEATYSKINCEDLRQFVPEGRKYLNCVSAVKGMSGKEIAVGLVRFIAVPSDKRAKTLRGLEFYCEIFEELRGELDDFAAALYAREVSEKIANGSDLILERNWDRIRKMSVVHKKAVQDLCTFVRKGKGTLKVTSDQRVQFRGSADRACKYALFHEVLTSAGIAYDVAVSELAKFVFHKGKGNLSELAYDAAGIDNVKSRIPECRKIRKSLSSGRVSDSRIARYLVSYLSAKPEDAGKYVTDCRVFLELHDLVSDFAKETVAEAEDAGTLFTDGHLDEELNEEIVRRGLALMTCSVMDVRQITGRDFVGEMRDGAAAQLWLEKLLKTGVASAPLQFSGVLFRQKGMSESVQRKGVAWAEKIAERIIDLQKRNLVDTLKEEEMKMKVLSVQWRIARIARARGEQERKLGLIEQAKRSLEIVDKLDGCNSAVRQLQQKLSEVREKSESALSAKERLQQALRRADFEKAGESAEVILKTSPDDMDANFAMGMLHFQKRQWKDAERHLLKCKASSPGEVAVWNNLAMVYLNMKRYDDAMLHAKKALSLAPDSEDVKDTVKQVESAIREQSRPKAGSETRRENKP